MTVGTFEWRGRAMAPSTSHARGLLLGVVVTALGCGGGAAGEVRDAKAEAGRRSVVIEHEPCEAAGQKTVSYDANKDGQPDVTVVLSGERRVCRITTLRREAKPSMYEYYDATGQVRRRELDDFGDGTANQIEHYEGGKLVRRDFDTANQGRLDTWDVYDPSTGKLVTRERDTTGSGRVDQWWTYDASGVTIARDRNGDGLPDPNGSLAFDRSGAPMKAAGTADAGASSSPASNAASSEPGDAGTAAPTDGGHGP